MSERFGIDIEINSGQARGAIAGVRTELTGLGTGASATTAKVNAAFQQLSGDLKSSYVEAATVIEQALERAFLNAEKTATSSAFRAAEKQRAAWSSAFSAMGSGGPKFGEFLTSDGDQVLDMFDGWKSGASGATSATNLLSQASDGLGINFGRLGAIAAGAFVVKKIGDYSDQFTSLQNQLKTVTDSSAELADVTADLFAVADRTRSAIGPTAAFYARLARNSDELGLSQSDLLGITETLTKAFKVGGASASETSSAMLQLSQGLASGTLRGDEFNSIMENADVLAKGLADSLGVSKGELRAMAEAGQISSDVVIDAIQGMKAEVDAAFAETAPTIDDLVTKLGNMAVMIAGKLTPVISPLVGALGSVVDILGQGVGLLADLGGPLFNALGGALGLAKDLLGVVSDVLGLVGDIAGGLGDALGTARDAAADLLGGRIDWEAMTKAIEAQKAAIAAEADALKKMETAGIDATNAVIAGMANLASTIATINIKQIFDDFETLTEVLGDIDPTIEKTKQYDAAMRALTRQFLDTNLTAEEFLAKKKAIREELLVDKDAAKEAAAAYEKLQSALRSLVEEFDPAAKLTRELAEAETVLNDAVDKGLISQIRATEILDAKTEAINEQIRALTALTIEAETAMSRTAQLAAANDNVGQGGLLGGTQRDFRGFSDVDGAIDRKFEDQARAFDEATAARDAALAKWRENPWNAEIDQIEAINLQAELMTRSFNAAADAITEFATTGKLNFRSLIDSFIADLTRLAIQKGLLNLLQMGGVAQNSTTLFGPPGLPGPVPGFASGGSFTVGGDGGTDTTPVYFRATRGERVTVQTPAQQSSQGGSSGGGGGGVTINNILDKRSLVAEFGGKDHTREVNNIVSRREARFGSRRR